MKYKFIIFPFVAVFGIGILFCYFPPFIPDYLNLQNTTKIYETYNLIITSLVTLIGIYVSVSLIAHEFFKQKSGIDFHKSFLINSGNSYYILFIVFSIVFIFISSLLTSLQNLNHSEISLIYYSSLLFLLIIFLFFFVSYNLFKSLRPEIIAEKELSKLNNTNIFIQQIQNEDIKKQAQLHENDHLNKVTNIILHLISESENIQTQVLIKNVTRKIGNLIIDEKDINNKNYIIERLISFYINIVDNSLQKSNNSIILKSISSFSKDIYDNICSRKESTKQVSKFTEHFFSRYINRLFQLNNEEVIIDFISTIRELIQNQIIFNLPKDKNIYDFNHFREQVETNFKYPSNYSKEDYNNSEKWQELSYNIYNIFGLILDKAIQFNKPEIINNCFEQMKDLNFQLKLEGIEVYKQTFFYIKSSELISEYTYTCYQKNIFVKGSDSKHLLPSLFSDLIINNHLAARNILQNYCFLLIKLQKIDKLDRWFLGGLSIGKIITLEGELGEISRKCAYNIEKNKLVKDCFDDCISTFKILKELYEKKLPNNFDLYFILKTRFENIKEILEKRNIKDNLNEKLTDLINSFHKEDSY